MPSQDPTGPNVKDLSIPATVRFQDLLTQSEAEDINLRTERPLVTLKRSEITIAYDWGDMVYIIPILRMDDATINELTHAQRVASNLTQEIEVVRNTLRGEVSRITQEKDTWEDIANEYKDRALSADAQLKRANAVIDYIIQRQS